MAGWGRRVAGTGYHVPGGGRHGPAPGFGRGEPRKRLQRCPEGRPRPLNGGWAAPALPGRGGRRGAGRCPSAYKTARSRPGPSAVPARGGLPAPVLERRHVGSMTGWQRRGRGPGGAEPVVL